MANNIFEKNHKILYNSVPDQRLTYANQLTVKNWNDIINILKVQANINADYIEKLHSWLIGSYDRTKPFEENIVSIPEDKNFAEYILELIEAVEAELERLNQIKADTQYVDVADEEISRRIDQVEQTKADVSYVDTKDEKITKKIDANTLNISANTQNIIRLIEHVISINNSITSLTNRVGDVEIEKADIQYVNDKFNQILGEGATETLDTIAEISKALEEHNDEYDSLLAVVGNKADKAYVEQIKEEIYENTNIGPIYAYKVLFNDGVSLEEKYVNGELGSGGGGGIDDDIILNSITPSTTAAVKNENLTLKYTFFREVQTTRLGNERVYVDGILYSSKSVNQGENTIIISNLSTGSHVVEVQVASGSLSSSLVYNVEVVELSIRSSFDGFGIYTNPITYRYTPIGNVEKTIHFEIDDDEYTEIVTESNKAMTYQFEELTHGVHKLVVYATATIGGIDVTSNILSYNVIVDNGGTDTIISCPFSTTKVTEGDLLQFNYVVFTPGSLYSNVSLKINGEEISNLVVNREQQTWSLRDYPTGKIVCSIESGGKSVSFEIDVKPSSVKVEAITHNLELHLTATGRSNNENESVRDIWENRGTRVVFNNFNWKSNGWIPDEENNTALRINGNARITIPFKIFDEDFRDEGKTIEFEFSTHEIRNYDSVLINCLSNGRGFELTSNIVKLSSEQTSIETKFKEDEKVRVSFVIEPLSENRLIYTYVNGIISGIVQYPDDDNFSQSNPVGISIGSDDATIDLYNIRIYNINLDHSDMLTNYIADTTDRQLKFNLYNKNNIFDSYGNIDYNKVVSRIPCLTFTGELPATKGDKKVVNVKYINNFDSSRNFESSGVSLDIQGTSSQYYPRKNYKFKLPNTYQLTNNSIPETVFCLKADYMESSHSHNTGLAKIVNTLYPETPASEANEKVQAAITGFPIVVWYRETENSPLKCLGVYNFNNDKDDTTTFGYTADFPNCESWEFKNNTSAHCLFQNDNFVDTVEVAKNFEARYPDKYTNYTNLSRVVSWVASTEGDLEKFKNEFSSYFNLDATLLYYCLTELFAMVDSRAKNLFLTTWDGNIWYPTFYDMDTAFGLNNEGVNDFAYQVEYHDIQGSQNVFNGESSVLWNNFEQAYADEIQEFYNNLRNNKLVTYDTVMNILYEQQISKICESNYNYDAVEKYKNPLVEDGIGTYLYIAQGSRLDHLKWWLYNRLNYMDSKYVASDYKDNYITLRIYTPEVYGSVIPNADAHITPYADQYVTVKYDENMFNDRGTHDVETVIEAPNQIFNDTPMIIYGASRISDIGDLSPLYAGTVDVSKGIKLKQLIVGNSASDYRNTNLKTLTIGNNELLTKLDVRNCPSLTQTIDASGCANIEEIYATGTSTTAVKVANGGNLKVLHLPNTITNLTILNQPFITEFVCNDYSNINTLRIENTPIDTLTIVQDAFDNLERIRLIDVDWTLNDTTILNKIMTLKGLNENGVNTDKAILTGKIHIRGTVPRYYIDDCIEYFGTDVVITADNVIPYYKCSFYNYDGTLLKEIIVEGGNEAIYSEGVPTHPYGYTFLGWSKEANSDIPDSDLVVNSRTKLYAIYDIPYLTTIILSTVLPSARTETSAVAIKNNAYIIGGYGDGYINEIIKLDTKHETLTKLNSSLPIAMANATAVAIGTNVYIFGGEDSSKINKIVKLDTKKDVITTLEVVLPSARQNITAAVIGDNAYIFGGKEQTLLDEIVKFDSTNETIITLPTKLPYNANNSSSVVIDDNAYIFGGNAIINSIIEFDGSSETTTILPNKLPYNVNNSSSVAIENSAYIFGGDSKLDAIVEFDNTSKTITTINNVLPTARTGTSAVAIGNNAYIFGGYSDTETNEIIRVIKK